jgi:hypothetical protein
MNAPKKSAITITSHAKQRLSERLPQIPKSQWEQLAYNARYKGLTDNQLQTTNEIDSNTKSWVFNTFKKDNSTQLRLYKDTVFVFSGNSHHCRTLVTVVPFGCNNL